MNLVALLFFLGMLACLGVALAALLRRRDDPKRMRNALTSRVSLSVLFFVLLMLAWFMGWIRPHGLGG